MPRGVAPKTHGLNESAAAVLRETQPATLGSVCSQLLTRSADAKARGAHHARSHRPTAASAALSTSSTPALRRATGDTRIVDHRDDDAWERADSTEAVEVSSLHAFYPVVAGGGTRSAPSRRRIVPHDKPCAHAAEGV